MKNIKISILGLGYVGLPLAVAFSKKYEVFGFDIDKSRIKNLNSFIDFTGEVSKKDLQNAKKLNFTYSLQDLKKSNYYIITVPTPINKSNNPDLNNIISATKMVATVLKKKDIVVFESTVYPGATEEVCVPILEKFSKLEFNKDFFVGYSPERMNPGDKKHSVQNIVKVTSGSNQYAANAVAKLYKSIVKAGIFKASSIKVAEAAKIIENTQRDINIALINELALIFNFLKIDTQEILNAAGTKWNFIKFTPGFVGGHCIGVDPYYLTYKAKKIGYNPKIILAGRKLNNQMSANVSRIFLKKMIQKKINIKKSKILVLGITFKENIPDIRNTKIIDLVKILKKKCSLVDVYDPIADFKEVKKKYDLNLIRKLKNNFYDGIILAVRHQNFLELGINRIKKFGKNKSIIYDLKYLFSSRQTDLRL